MGHRVQWEKQGVYGEFFGQLCVRELFEAVLSISSDSRFPLARYRLYDYSGVQSHDINLDELKPLGLLNYHSVMLCQVPQAPGVTAYVSVREDVTAMIESFIRLQTVPFERRIFSSVKEARAWIEQCQWSEAGTS